MARSLRSLYGLMRFDKQNRQLLEGQGLPCPQVGAQHAAPLQTRYPLPDLIVKIHKARADSLASPRDADQDRTRRVAAH